MICFGNGASARKFTKSSSSQHVRHRAYVPLLWFTAALTTGLIGLFAPPEELSAGAVLGCFVFYALAHQADFDVCWCKGSVAERIFEPLMERIRRDGGAIVGSKAVTDVKARWGGCTGVFAHCTLVYGVRTPVCLYCIRWYMCIPYMYTYSSKTLYIHTCTSMYMYMYWYWYIHTHIHQPDHALCCGVNEYTALDVPDYNATASCFRTCARTTGSPTCHAQVSNNGTVKGVVCRDVGSGERCEFDADAVIFAVGITGTVLLAMPLSNGWGSVEQLVGIC